MANAFTNYQYLMYPNQQVNTNYPSLTKTEENNSNVHPNDQEELKNIVQYIKNLKDLDKR